MARNIPEERRLYRGTTSQHAAYTGPQGEVTVDTSKNTVVVQDGSTAGGHPLAKDSAVVHNTGNETVAGVKTFTSNVNLSQTGPSVRLQQTDITKGTPPDAAQHANVVFLDSTGWLSSDGARTGLVENSYNTDGSMAVKLGAYAPVAGSTDYAMLSVVYTSSGDTYATCPTPPDADDSSTKIATTAWVNKRISLLTRQARTSNLYVYVSLDGVDDYTEEGRGLSSDLPFRTLRYALWYVSAFYHLGHYNAYIYLATGDYSNDTNSDFPDYSAGDGRIYIYGGSTDATETIIPNVVCYASSRYYLLNLTIKPLTSTAAVSLNQAHLYLYNVNIDITADDSLTFGFSLYRSASVNVLASNTTSSWIPGVTFTCADRSIHALIYCRFGSSFVCTADLTVDGNLTVSRATVISSLQSSFSMYTASDYTVPGRMPVFTTTDGSTVTGKRYIAEYNSTVYVAGQGSEFLPGTEDGATSAYGTYY